MSNGMQAQIDQITHVQREHDKQMMAVSLALQKIVDRLDSPQTGDQALYREIQEIKERERSQNLRSAYNAGWIAGGIAVGGGVAGVVWKLIGAM